MGKTFWIDQNNFQMVFQEIDTQLHILQSLMWSMESNMQARISNALTTTPDQQQRIEELEREVDNLHKIVAALQMETPELETNQTT